MTGPGERLEVIFDGSTNPGTVELNGWVLRFDKDKDAKAVFELLSLLRDRSARLSELRAHWSRALFALAEDVEHGRAR